MAAGHGVAVTLAGHGGTAVAAAAPHAPHRELPPWVCVAARTQAPRIDSSRASPACSRPSPKTAAPAQMRAARRWPRPQPSLPPRPPPLSFPRQWLCAPPRSRPAQRAVHGSCAWLPTRLPHQHQQPSPVHAVWWAARWWWRMAQQRTAQPRTARRRVAWVAPSAQVAPSAERAPQAQRWPRTAPLGAPPRVPP